MVKRTNFRHYNLDAATRNNFNITTFGGVDFSSQKFNVSSNHSIDLQNFIYRSKGINGCIQKRYGYEELFHVQPIEFLAKSFDSSLSQSQTIYHNGDLQADGTYNEPSFNALWKFKADDNKEHIIAHIGFLLYEILNITDSNSLSIVPITDETGVFLASDGTYKYRYYKYENFKSFAFVGGNKLWFFGGNHYMVISYSSSGVLSIKSVEENENTFIPTTTNNITYTDSIISGRANIDYPNMLTMWRKNRLLSGTTKGESILSTTAYYEYTLDGSLLLKDTKTDISNMNNTALANRFAVLTQRSKEALADIHIVLEERGTK